MMVPRLLILTTLLIAATSLTLQDSSQHQLLPQTAQHRLDLTPNHLLNIEGEFCSKLPEEQRKLLFERI